jgi:hypothetical protein
LADTAAAFQFDPMHYGSNFSLRNAVINNGGGLSAGKYTMTEGVPAGCHLDQIEFINLDPSTANAIISKIVEISLAPGETVRIIFHRAPALEA